MDKKKRFVPLKKNISVLRILKDMLDSIIIYRNEHKLISDFFEQNKIRLAVLSADEERDLRVHLFGMSTMTSKRMWVIKYSKKPTELFGDDQELKKSFDVFSLSIMRVEKKSFIEYVLFKFLEISEIKKRD